MGASKYEGWPRTSSGLIEFSVYNSDPMAGPGIARLRVAAALNEEIFGNRWYILRLQDSSMRQTRMPLTHFGPFEAPSFSRDHVINPHFTLHLITFQHFCPLSNDFMIFTIHPMHYFLDWCELSRLLKMFCITWLTGPTDFLPLPTAAQPSCAFLQHHPSKNSIILIGQLIALNKETWNLASGFDGVPNSFLNHLP